MNIDFHHLSTNWLTPFQIVDAKRILDTYIIWSMKASLLSNDLNIQIYHSSNRIERTEYKAVDSQSLEKIP